MDKRHIPEQSAPKGRAIMSLNSILPEKGDEFHQPCWKRQDSDEFTFYIEKLGIPFLKINRNGSITDWSSSIIDLIEIDESKVRDESFDELINYSSILKSSQLLIEKSFETGNFQELLHEEDESLFLVRVIPTIDGLAAYVIFEDRSLQKQFENLLTFHHQMEAVSHIAAGVAHELRNPLSVIKGFLQLANLTNDFKKYYDTILSEINRMNGIIEDFLSVSSKKIERKPQSPNQIMESLEEIIKAECILHNVEFILDIKKTTALVHVNESMVKQVMLNLLRNSVEAFGKSNTTRTFLIETEIKDGDYCILIHDNGKGIPEDVLKQLGKPFFTTKERGTGIGIPLCKKIIEDHGGTFRIESKFNLGTTVILTLPLST